jgi:hypothetical protein
MQRGVPVFCISAVTAIDIARLGIHFIGRAVARRSSARYQESESHTFSHPGRVLPFSVICASALTLSSPSLMLRCKSFVPDDIYYSTAYASSHYMSEASQGGVCETAIANHRPRVSIDLFLSIQPDISERLTSMTGAKTNELSLERLAAHVSLTPQCWDQNLESFTEADRSATTICASRRTLRPGRKLGFAIREYRCLRTDSILRPREQNVCVTAPAAAGESYGDAPRLAPASGFIRVFRQIV